MCYSNKKYAGGQLMTNERVHKIFSVMQSIVLIIASVCLIAACIGIYRSGADPIYTPEKVAAAFSDIAVPVWMCIVLIAGGILLNLGSPLREKKRKAEKNHELILKRLHEKGALDQADSSLRAAVAAQQKKRRLHKTVSLALLALGSGIFLIYALNGNHYHQSQINDSMIHAVQLLLPCMAVPFGYAVFTAYFCQSSMQKEIDLMKQATAGIPGKKPAAVSAKNRSKQLLAVRLTLLLLAISLLAYGYSTGGTEDVETKAVNICTECVGLG